MSKQNTFIHLNFNSLVNQILREADELGRAYRQVVGDTKDPEVGSEGSRSWFVTKDAYSRYKQAQERANRLEKRYSNKVPIMHNIFSARLAETGGDMVTALKYLFSKADEEISVSVIRSWSQAMHSEADDHSFFLLRGYTSNLHEWYPINAETSSDKKEKRANWASSERINTLNRYPGFQHDEGITNLKDIKWTSFDISINREHLAEVLPDYYQAKSFLEKNRLVHTNAPKFTSFTKRLPNGEVEEYEFYPLSGYLKSVIDENGDTYNFEEAEGVTPNAADFEDNNNQ
jgi:hypothetical protein